MVVGHAGTPISSITVTNYPVAGPIFSGEHLQPSICLEDLDVATDGGERKREDRGVGATR